MLIQCQCGQKYNIKESMYGKVVRCRKCEANMQIGYPAQQPQAPAPIQQAAPQYLPPQPQAAPQYLPPQPQAAPQYLPPQPQAAPQPAAVPQQGTYDPNPLADPSPYSQPLTYGQPQPYGAFPAAAVPGRRPKPKQIRYDFSKVNLGLKLIFGGTVTSILCAFGVIGFAMLLMPLMAVMMLGGMFLGSLITIAGYILCIFVPVESMARPLIIGSVVSQSLNMLCSIGNMFMGGQGSPLFNLIGGISATVAMTLFLLFLKKVAEFVDNNSAAHDAYSLLVFYWILIGVFFGFIIGLFPIAMIGEPIVAAAYLIIGLIGMLVACLIWFVHFMTFINSLEFKRSTTRRKKY